MNMLLKKEVFVPDVRVALSAAVQGPQQPRFEQQQQQRSPFEDIKRQQQQAQQRQL